MSLAAERTYLAYIRTGLALMAAGVAVVGALPNAGAENLRRVIGIALILASVAVLIDARMRWAAVDQAMRRGEPLPPIRRQVQWLSWLVAAAAVAALVLIFVV